MKITNNTDSLKLTLKDYKSAEEEILIIYPQKDFDWYEQKEHSITHKRKKLNYYHLFKKQKACYYQFNACIDRVIARKYIDMLFPWYIKPFGYLGTYIMLPNYKKFLDEMMKDLQKNKIDKLIVDLRNNPGGSSEVGNLLMYYCNIPDSIKGTSVDQQISELYIKQNCKNFKPKKKIPYKILNMNLGERDENYSFFANFKNNNSSWDNTSDLKHKFSGKLILLIGSSTFSSAADLAIILSDNRQSTIIGEPLGQKPDCFGDFCFFNLPKTKTQVTVSTKRFLRPDQRKSNESTLHPDIDVYPTIDDLLEGKDPVLEKALKL